MLSSQHTGGDGGLTVAEDPLGCGRVQSTSRVQTARLRPGTGRGFQTIQRGMAARAERGVTGRASKRLDLLGMAMLAIPNQSVDVSVSDSEVWALLVGTGKAFCVHPLRGTSAAFHLTPGARLPQEQVSPLRRRGDRWGNQAGCGA
jgi:hypothetical protein